ncbi:Iron-containing superoxide dismutase [Entamoeba histolytica HM-3:IMSS]|uniref:Superoxide dismutase [Fe] n=6 Tax=Entamoeba histolytica TaxID=5759 RepID=SODF_ENTH1|nr:Iron-containing superoxide dismutase [Entamoeba histolytica HM-1:IMSS]P34107.1 RecName: Full=Superoxide dismutase [Fe] [Entamoeba histolytica HM-1:IMSS]EMD44847.1 iron-containing superoxide dismutase, putative [Entamoeba histolytica KU27]EMS12638.1 Iron-containing superoxide dismutase [Entamoeba histolytica HM-3:IMSS]CAA50204.1 superoxide dismutase [Entamoeba histolytica]EAL43440.1 Iron-containing superoxide dismutase [Entamoeba histolytica HM-1:IMSS]BAN38722.1 iron-containing superoxide d|eukprot:XP_648827.1 Iron-containing superoxide dismutase [Entamoeba histolytica HM-1:IMSS]
MSFQLPQLPYAYNALEPHISKETLEFHHDKHHATYVNKLNGLVKGTEQEHKTLEELIKQKPTQAIYNNAAQAWNHAFYWKCMCGCGVKPSEQLIAKLTAAFGGLEEFKKKFTEKAVGHFGSGWCWLVEHDGKLEIIDTHDAVNPMTNGMKPLLTCDVWEHAYYIDTRNNRAAYLEHWWNVVNWKFVEEQL